MHGQIPHAQAGTGMPVAGAWNNYEGLPTNYSEKINDVLAAAGYVVLGLYEVDV